MKRKQLRDHLKGRPCVDCGGRFPPCVMDFDHVGGEKNQRPKKSNTRNSGNMSSLGRWDFIREVGKCEVVCCNCHRIRTMRRKEYLRKPPTPTLQTRGLFDS